MVRPPNVLPWKNGSYIWKAITRVWSKLIEGVKWDVGNEAAIRIVSNLLLEETVCRYVSETGG
ncbi:conserved hypothetical protein [Ricinus communis]|uniref:Uncharacterized protein n=1 Tax=Ricinus communis TaxID=3988 RepID=B9SQJ4_RICCO|nr:conserved hypothetical protein [Ricinus communis]